MPRTTKHPGVLPALLCLLALLCLAAPAQAAEAEAEAPAEESFALAPGARVLVLPFTCYILPVEYQDAQGSVLQSLESNLVYALRQHGVEARTEKDGFDKKAPSASGSALESPDDVYLPLTPESSLSKDARGGLKAEPLREGQWEKEAPNSHLMAGTPPAQLDDSDIVPSGTLMLQPRAESRAERAGTPLEAEKPAPEPENAELGNQVIAQALGESGITQKAARAGFDYILTGSVSFIQADLKPAVYAGKREVTSLRTAFSCSYRLLDTRDGKVAAFGSASGRSGKVLTLNQDTHSEEQINNSVSVVLNQSIQAAALRLADDLAAPGGADRGENPASEPADHDYYQDSPGKRLKPAQ